MDCTKFKAGQVYFTNSGGLGLSFTFSVCVLFTYDNTNAQIFIINLNQE
jgi:hypothetical protein